MAGTGGEGKGGRRKESGARDATTAATGDELRRGTLTGHEKHRRTGEGRVKRLLLRESGDDCPVACVASGFYSGRASG